MAGSSAFPDDPTVVGRPIRTPNVVFFTKIFSQMAPFASTKIIISNDKYYWFLLDKDTDLLMNRISEAVTANSMPY